MKTKKDITIIIAPYTITNYPLIGAAYLETYLTKYNFSVEILDISAFLNMHQQEFKPIKISDLNSWNNPETVRNNFNFLINNSKFKELIDNIDSNIIGFSVFSSNKFFAIELTKYLKNLKKDLIIVFGGPECFVTGWCEYMHQISSNAIDLFVTNEGEQPLLKLLSNLKSNKPIDSIEDTIYCQNQNFKINTKSNDLLNLDDLPFPTYNGFQKYKYNTNTYPLLFSRGCISRCVFCDVNRYWKKFRQRSPENLLKEIRFQIVKNNVRKFFFCDSLVNADIKKLERFCDLIIDSRTPVELYGIGVAKNYMTLEIMKKLKAAGFKEFEFGIESGAQNVISNMRKLHKQEDIDFVIKNTYDAGIKCNIDLIAGFPLETEDDFLLTCKMLKRNKKYIYQVVGLDICHIGKDRAIENNLIEKFGLNYYGNETDNEWTDKIGNTLKTRYQRKMKLFKIIRMYGIKYSQNVYFNELMARKIMLSKFEIFFEYFKDYFYKYIFKFLYFLGNKFFNEKKNCGC